jgi:hypothetical protein
MGGTRKRLILDEFIFRSNNIHRFKYDYSKSKYKNIDTNIIISCPIHGDFQQTPKAHFRGFGCRKCSRNALKTTDWFVNSAKNICGDRYDYSLSRYRGIDKSVKIICKIHGEFLQTPYQHINMKRGCPKCGGSFPLNIHLFVKRSKTIHGNLYDYSDVIYKNACEKIKLRCNRCNKTFFQRPYAHMNGAGCPHCCHTISKREVAFLDYLKIPENKRQHKIHSFYVDGIDGINVYEFLGDYWHGNPILYKSQEMNESAKKTYGELYNETTNRFDKIRKLGYKIFYIW